VRIACARRARLSVSIRLTPALQGQGSPDPSFPASLWGVGMERTVAISLAGFALAVAFMLWTYIH
jgi:hypothetical protein